MRGWRRVHITLTLNFSVDIKRPRRDYDVLLRCVDRPFAHAYMSLCSYELCMNAVVYRVFCSTDCSYFVAVYVSVVWSLFSRGWKGNEKRIRVLTETRERERIKNIKQYTLYFRPIDLKQTPIGIFDETRQREYAVDECTNVLQPDGLIQDVELLSATVNQGLSSRPAGRSADGGLESSSERR